MNTPPQDAESVTHLWLTRWFERLRIQYGTIGATVVFGSFPAGIVLTYAVARWSYMNPTYLYSLLAILVVTSVAPYLIWYYDSHLFPEFRTKVDPLIQADGVVAAIGKRYHTLLAKRWWIAAVLASLPIPVLLHVGDPFLTQRGLFGGSDLLFWIVGGLLLWIGVIVGIGFLLVAITFLAIRDVAAEPLEIDPMHPDGLGGMSAIGQYAIRTTTLFSLGALLIPVQLQYAATVGEAATTLIYIMGSAYGLFIAGSFLYPTIKINRKAEAIRAEILDDLRQQYYTLKDRADEPTIGVSVDATDQATEQKLNRLQEEYREYRNVRLYPLQLPILIRLFTSVILPILLIGIEYAIQSIAIF